MSLRTRFERALGLGPSDEPRPITVEARRSAKVRPLVSTPGARVRLVSDGWDRHIGGVSLMCHRRGIAVERVEGPAGLWLDGQPVSPDELRRSLS